MMKIANFIPGLGQFIQGRVGAGLVIAFTFYGSIFVLRVIWKGVNPGFYALLIGWFWVWLFSYLDACRKGERRRKPTVPIGEGERRKDLADSSQKDK